MAWSGDEGRAINLWRRWYSEHVMPRPGGQPVSPLLHVSSTDDGPGGEFTGATEQQPGRLSGALGPGRAWTTTCGGSTPAGTSAGPVRRRDPLVRDGHMGCGPSALSRGLAPVSANAARHGCATAFVVRARTCLPRDLLGQRPSRMAAGPPGVGARSSASAPDGSEPAHSFWLQDVSGLLDLSNPGVQSRARGHGQRADRDVRHRYLSRRLQLRPARVLASPRRRSTVVGRRKTFTCKAISTSGTPCSSATAGS